MNGKVGVKMKLMTRDFLIIIGIMTLVTLGWRFLEVIMDGQIIESKAHTIVATLLTWSLYKNFEK